MHTDKQANFVWTAFSSRLLYLTASWIGWWCDGFSVARWFLGGELVGGEMVSRWRVGWWRNSLVARWPDTVTRDRVTKAHTHTHTIHIYLPFTRKSKRWKSKDVKIVAAEISLINSVPVRIEFSRVLTLSKTRPSSDVWNCENVMFGWKGIDRSIYE